MTKLLSILFFFVPFIAFGSTTPVDSLLTIKSKAAIIVSQQQERNIIRWMITLVFALFTFISYGQNFVVNSFDGNHWADNCTCKSGDDDYNNSITLDLNTAGKPVSVSVITYCRKTGGTTTYQSKCSYSLNTADCCSDSYISWTPSNVTISGPASGSYCQSQTINLNAPSAYKQYVWQGSYFIVLKAGNETKAVRMLKL